MPTYQHAEALPACLDSVLQQTYQNIEVIVVNDGSTDGTRDVLEEYTYDDRVTLVWQENQGSNSARNTGFTASKGEYVIFCDADVVMKSRCIEEMYKALQEHEDASYAYCSFRFGFWTMKGVQFDAKKLREMNYINSATLVRRRHMPVWDEAIKRFQDWDVFLTMLKEGHTGVLVDEVLYHVRVIGKSRIGSRWLPSFAYSLPWDVIGWKPHAVAAYERARETIAKKHAL